MRSTEQQTLSDDHDDERKPTSQSSHHDPPEDHLLHDRGGNHRRDHERHHVGPVSADLVDSLGVTDERHVERNDDRPDRQLCAEGTEPDHRSPPEIGPPWGESDVGAEITRSPPPARETTPPHRRSVADSGQERHVHGDRPAEVDHGLEQELGHDERPAEHGDGSARSTRVY